MHNLRIRKTSVYDTLENCPTSRPRSKNNGLLLRLSIVTRSCVFSVQCNLLGNTKLIGPFLDDVIVNISKFCNSRDLKSVYKIQFLFTFYAQISFPILTPPLEQKPWGQVIDQLLLKPSRTSVWVNLDEGREGP